MRTLEQIEKRAKYLGLKGEGLVFCGKVYAKNPIDEIVMIEIFHNNPLCPTDYYLKNFLEYAGYTFEEKEIEVEWHLISSERAPWKSREGMVCMVDYSAEHGTVRAFHTYDFDDIFVE